MSIGVMFAPRATHHMDQHRALSEEIMRITHTGVAAAVTVASLGGLGFLAVSDRPQAKHAAVRKLVSPPVEVRTVTVTRTIYRTKVVHVHRHRRRAAAPPAPARVPVIAPAPAPVAAVATPATPTRPAVVPATPTRPAIVRAPAPAKARPAGGDDVRDREHESRDG
jgi:hypothetical protein